MDHDSGTPTVFSKEMYQTKFDAGTYLGYCYQPAQSPEQSDNWRFVKFVLSNLSRTFSSGSLPRTDVPLVTLITRKRTIISGPMGWLDWW